MSMDFNILQDDDDNKYIVIRLQRQSTNNDISANVNTNLDMATVLAVFEIIKNGMIQEVKNTEKMH